MSNKQYLGKRWRNVSILFSIFLMVVFASDMLREIVIFDQETEMIINELDRDVRNEVENEIVQISEDINLVTDNLKESLVIQSEENLSGLIFASNMYVRMNSSNTELEMKDAISLLAQEYTTLDEKHNYYVFDIDGNLHYNGETNSFVTTDMSDEEDYLNTLYIQEFLTSLAVVNKTSVSYYEQVEDHLVEFAMFGIEIEGTDLIIANIVNMKAYSSEQRSSFIEGFEDKYSNSQNNLFILDDQGEVLYHSNEEFIGSNINTSVDPTLTSFLNNIIDYTSAKSSGYVEFDFYQNFIDGDKEENIGYVKEKTEWSLIIGTSVASNKYNDIIENYKDANYLLMATIKLPSYILILVISIIIYTYLNSTIKKSQIIVAEDERLYKKFADFTSEIVIITNKLGEIIFTNKLGQESIYGLRDFSTKICFDQILVEEEGYYILYGFLEDYFVKYITESIEYKHQPADLYMITDVTEKIKTERKLKELSLVDELTKLGNRRMMVKEYNEVILPNVKQGNDGFLAMLDLDDFKPANDLYGHSYGDQVLRNVATIFQNNQDKNMFIYRIGGDEFALVFINSVLDEVIEKLTKMREEVETFEYFRKISVSFSAGVTAMKVNDKQRRLSDYYDRADKLLYTSKNNGKRKISTK